jgi:esterase/lipase superfamily enzyme
LPDGARRAGEVQWPSSPVDPSREFATIDARRLELGAALAAFRGELAHTPHRRVLVFVHGFNTNFSEAVFRFAQIVHDGGVNSVPVIFTWPSRGRFIDYSYDHDSATYSRDSLELTLQALIDDKAVGEIDILAHSMGNWLTLEALRQLSIRKGALPAKIKDVMLASPDIHFDVFRRQIEQIKTRRDAFTLFLSRDDRALAASQTVSGDKVRLGTVDPESGPIRSALAKARVRSVELTNVSTGDTLNHFKFASSPEIVRLVGERLMSGQPLGEQRATLGGAIVTMAAKTTGTVGEIAGQVLTLPVSIIDPHTH